MSSQEEKLTELIEKSIKTFNMETGEIIDRISISPVYKAGTMEILSYNIQLKVVKIKNNVH